MGWFLYNILFAIGYTLMLPRFLLRMRKRGGYGKDFFHRLGMFSDELQARLSSGDWIWIQAVSVGEIYVALALIGEMRQKGCKQSFLISTTTSTAYAILNRKMDSRDLAIYFPADFPLIVRKVFKIVRPKLLILVESEIWPNLIRYAYKSKVPVVLVNGRISESSSKGYRIMKPLFKKVINMFRLVLVQSDGDKKRLIELGANPDLPEVCGSLKYDVARCDTAGTELSRKILDACGANQKKIIVGGSTWAGEEEALVKVYKDIKDKIPGIFLVLVPRHAERRSEVESVLLAHDVNYLKRTDIDTDDLSAVQSTSALLVDTTGELVGYYACSDVIFVGKSLTQHGGQNFIEPAMFGKPVVVGPNLENFPVVADDFISGDAFVQISSNDELARAVKKLLTDEAYCKDLGMRASHLVKDKQGLLGRIAERINSLAT